MVSDLHETERCCGALHDHQHIQGIIVFTQRLRDEAVVVRVPHTAGQNTVNIQHARLLVQLILDFGALQTAHIKAGDTMLVTIHMLVSTDSGTAAQAYKAQTAPCSLQRISFSGQQVFTAASEVVDKTTLSLTDEDFPNLHQTVT